MRPVWFCRECGVSIHQWCVVVVVIGRLMFAWSFVFFFFFQAEDGIRDLVRSRGLGDVYKRQALRRASVGYTSRDTDLLADNHEPVVAMSAWLCSAVSCTHLTLPTIYSV